MLLIVGGMKTGKSHLVDEGYSRWNILKVITVFLRSPESSNSNVRCFSFHKYMLTFPYNRKIFLIGK